MELRTARWLLVLIASSSALAACGFEKVDPNCPGGPGLALAASARDVGAMQSPGCGTGPVQTPPAPTPFGRLSPQERAISGSDPTVPRSLIARLVLRHVLLTLPEPLPSPQALCGWTPQGYVGCTLPGSARVLDIGVRPLPGLPWELRLLPGPGFTGALTLARVAHAREYADTAVLTPRPGVRTLARVEELARAGVLPYTAVER